MTNSTLAASLWQDFKYAARLLRLNPGFAATAILSLAIGIAANTSIFTLVDQVLLRLLPVENPQELVEFRMEGGRVGSQSGDGVHRFSSPVYLAVRAQNTGFSSVTGQSPARVSMMSEERSEMLDTGWVAGNFFQTLGVRPHIGRVLTSEDDRLGNSNPVVVLQYDFWRNRF